MHSHAATPTTTPTSSANKRTNRQTLITNHLDMIHQPDVSRTTSGKETLRCQNTRPQNSALMLHHPTRWTPEQCQTDKCVKFVFYNADRHPANFANLGWVDSPDLSGQYSRDWSEHVNLIGPVNESLKNLRKQHVNGEKWIVATKVQTAYVVMSFGAPISRGSANIGANSVIFLCVMVRCSFSPP